MTTKRKPRDYKREYQLYQGRPDQIKERASRNKARREMVKAGKAHKGDGLDVAHLDDNEMSNDMSNLAMQTKKKNRSNNDREGRKTRSITTRRR